MSNLFLSFRSLKPKITKKRINNSVVSQANQSFIPGLVSEIYSVKGLEITFGKNLHKIDNSSFSGVSLKVLLFCSVFKSDIPFKIIFL